MGFVENFILFLAVKNLEDRLRFGQATYNKLNLEHFWDTVYISILYIQEYCLFLF